MVTGLLSERRPSAAMPAASSAAAAATRKAGPAPAASAARPPAEDPAAKPIPVAASSQANPSVSTAWGKQPLGEGEAGDQRRETVHPAARATAAICGTVPAAGNKNVPAARAVRAAVNRRWAGACQSRVPYHS